MPTYAEAPTSPRRITDRLFRFSMIYNWIFQPRGAEREAFLNQRRVFILPSKQGFIFGVALIVMLFSAINYDLSLGFVLTFLLGGLGLVTMLFSFRNQAHLTLQAGRVNPVFVGQAAQFEFALLNPKPHERGAIWLRAFAQGVARGKGQGALVGATVLDVPAAMQDGAELRPGVTHAALALPATQRGWLQPGRWIVQTTYPLGFFRVWSYWQPSMAALVYPKPEDELVPFPHSPQGSGTGAPAGAGSDDFAGLREYQSADNPRHIAWKVASRQMESGGPLLTKHFSGEAACEVWFDFSQQPRALDVEQWLARLTRWALSAEAQGLAYGLKMPAEQIMPARGEAHLARVLRALALHGTAAVQA